MIKIEERDERVYELTVPRDLVEEVFEDDTVKVFLTESQMREIERAWARSCTEESLKWIEDLIGS